MSFAAITILSLALGQALAFDLSIHDGCVKEIVGFSNEAIAAASGKLQLPPEHLMDAVILTDGNVEKLSPLTWTHVDTIAEDNIAKTLSLTTKATFKQIDAKYKCFLKVFNFEVPCESVHVSLRNLSMKLTIVLDRENGLMHIKDVSVSEGFYHFEGKFYEAPFVTSGHMSAELRDKVAKYIEKLINKGGAQMPIDQLQKCQ